MAMMERGETMEHPPGLQGTYEGACTICLQGCDTALVFGGQAEWIVAGLMMLGIRDYDEAVAMVSQATGCDLGMVPNGTVQVRLQCCEACAAQSGTGMREGLIASGALPCYRPQR
jgi:hypothetical protein